MKYKNVWLCSCLACFQKSLEISTGMQSPSQWEDFLWLWDCRWKTHAKDELPLTFHPSVYFEIVFLLLRKVPPLSFCFTLTSVTSMGRTCRIPVLLWSLITHLRHEDKSRRTWEPSPEVFTQKIWIQVLAIIIDQFCDCGQIFLPFPVT